MTRDAKIFIFREIIKSRRDLISRQIFVRTHFIF